MVVANGHPKPSGQKMVKKWSASTCPEYRKYEWFWKWWKSDEKMVFDSRVWKTDGLDDHVFATTLQRTWSRRPSPLKGCFRHIIIKTISGGHSQSQGLGQSRGQGQGPRPCHCPGLGWPWIAKLQCTSWGMYAQQHWKVGWMARACGSCFYRCGDCAGLEGFHAHALSCFCVSGSACDPSGMKLHMRPKSDSQTQYTQSIIKTHKLQTKIVEQKNTMPIVCVPTLIYKSKKRNQWNTICCQVWPKPFVHQFS